MNLNVFNDVTVGMYGLLSICAYACAGATSSCASAASN